MSEQVEIDQETYDRLIAEGKSERIARAKAKAAAVRKAKAQAREEVGAADEGAARSEPAEAAVGGGSEGVPATKAATATEEVPAGRLTPAQRAARVAAALGPDGGGPNLQTREEHTHRLLAMIPPEGIQQVQSKQQDKVYTWPHLFAVEFVSLLAVSALLLVVSYFLDPTFRALANPNLTPNPSKAPWYFLGLQEMLTMFHPMVAGVTIPGIALVGLGMAGYVDKNPSNKPEDRKFAVALMTLFLMFWAALVIVGSFFRGEGFNFILPWRQGVHHIFDL